MRLTNDSGQYLLTQLSPGIYSVGVSATGFKQISQENVVLYAGDQMALAVFHGHRRES